MCGICATVSLRESNDKDPFLHAPDLKDISDRLKRRGPDNFQELSISLHDSVQLSLISSVLDLRGTQPSLQPIKDELGNILLWNGEIFGGPLLDHIEECDSDTKVLSEKLFSCQNDTEILETFASIYGPYAFIFYQNTGRLWFGRDVFGRRSLLWKVFQSSFCLSSVASSNEKWLEVSTKGIFCLDLKHSCTKRSFVIHCYCWASTASGLSLQTENCEQLFSNMPIFCSEEHRLMSPVSKPLNRLLPSEEQSSCYSLSAEHFKSSNSDLFLKLLEMTILREKVLEFEQILSEAVQKRVQNHQQLCKKCYTLKRTEEINKNCKHVSSGILFSGGLDSIVIACLADRHLPDDVPIDLMNVAFASNKSCKNLEASGGNSAFNTPDRLTGKSGLMELKRVCPSRKWNFVEINVNEDELASCRQSIISHLLHPSSTVLDDSIGCALWFAARADGVVSPEGVSYERYQSSARVLLVGMGADEQLGGYSRHRGKFSSFGWSGLLDEITLELDRIGSRNLGRDDRCEEY